MCWESRIYINFKKKIHLVTDSMLTNVKIHFFNSLVSTKSNGGMTWWSYQVWDVFGEIPIEAGVLESRRIKETEDQSVSLPTSPHHTVPCKMGKTAGWFCWVWKWHLEHQMQKWNGRQKLLQIHHFYFLGKQEVWSKQIFQISGFQLHIRIRCVLNRKLISQRLENIQTKPVKYSCILMRQYLKSL